MTEISLISVVCPTYNEVDNIESLLRFFIESLPANKELFIIDGGSNDGTIELIQSYERKHTNIHLLHNKNKYVPFALNMAIEKCRGDIVVRLDAHTIYAQDYFQQIFNTFNATNADIVGGPMNASFNTPVQSAVAYCTSCVFGVGNSMFHNKDFEGYTDSVYLGAWKRKIFATTGLFDTEMLRNQDDEFHYRAQSLGFKVYLNPKIKSEYFPRKTFASLFRQYFQYGLFKPTVLKKVKSGFKLRHLIPAGFVSYILLMPVLFAIIGWPAFLPLCFYLLANFYFSFSNTANTQGIILRPLVFIILHTAYGLGFILGLNNNVRNFMFR